jgi:hypothetical protein
MTPDPHIFNAGKVPANTASKQMQMR